MDEENFQECDETKVEDPKTERESTKSLSLKRDNKSRTAPGIKKSPLKRRSKSDSSGSSTTVRVSNRKERRQRAAP
eukprot:9699713-Karenia_brevis.AAC.1